MEHKLSIYNSLTRKKELFVPIDPKKVGMYVCGPTVYGDAHLGHARPAITFDVLFRYLSYLGYSVRYVRNITDVGHLEADADEGADKVEAKAKFEQIEPMEIVQRYLNNYRVNMQQLNVLSPSIEPQASGHIIEQQQMVRKIINNGYAYVVNGSVYFDVAKYNLKYNYGKLSGRKIEELLANTRELSGQKEKRSPFDFALWKKASPGHLMHWPSEWGEGYPGWHLECSAMSAKYLGDTFDIHGGGMDLLFPHHECEIAQSTSVLGKDHVNYWMHNNMITINGQKMGRSLNNFINLNEFFSGKHKLLDRPYSAMTIRFFILQAHYRSTADFSNEALQASEKGMKRLLKALEAINTVKPSARSSYNVAALIDNCFSALNDDLNTPIAIAQLFEGVKLINLLLEGRETLSVPDLDTFIKFMRLVSFDLLGIKDENIEDMSKGIEEKLMELIIGLRLEARNKKDFTTSDTIRDKLISAGICLKDSKEGTVWEKL